MNDQPTVLLNKFTDFLDNRDSVAFLRLSHNSWAAHRTPAGRYRLKPTLNLGDDFPFLCSYRPSFLPPSYFVDYLRKIQAFCPVGNFLVDEFSLESLDDVRVFKENFSKGKNVSFKHGDKKRQKLLDDRRVFDSFC